MKILSFILVACSTLLLIGLLYSGLKEPAEPVITGSANTQLYSLDHSVLKVDGDTIFVLEGTVQQDILGNIRSKDLSPQTYKITTSEGSDKSKETIYEYDRLYITAENGVNEGYYRILFTTSLDW